MSRFRGFALPPLFLFVLFLFYIGESTGRKVTTPGPFPFSITIPLKSTKIIRKWMKEGGKTRLNLHPRFSSRFTKDLGLPPEVAECRKASTTASSSSDSYSSASVEYMQLMFDWCRWEWSFEGKYGIWDDDFRYQVYSLGIINRATAEVNFYVNLDADEATSNASSIRFFRDCLHPTEKIQEIARAIKWTIDTHPETAATDDDEDDDDENDGKEETIERLSSSSSSSKAFCRTTLPEMRRNFTTGLRKNTNLCFKAIRPRDQTILDYLATTVNQSIVATDYTIAHVCIMGREKLQDWRLTGIADQRRTGIGGVGFDVEGDAAARNRYLSVDLSSSLPGFKIVVILLMVVFLPMVLLKIIPLENDLPRINNQFLVNIVQGTATEILMERNERDKEEARKAREAKSGTGKSTKKRNDDGGAAESVASCFSMDVFRSTDATRGSAVTMDVLEEEEEDSVERDENENLLPPKPMVVEAESLDGTVKGRMNLEYNRHNEMEDLKWEGPKSDHRKQPNAYRPEPKCYVFVTLDHHTPNMFMSMQNFFNKKISFSFVCGKWAAKRLGVILAIARRFLLLLFLSCHSVVLMLILDRIFYGDVVSKLFAFKDRFEVDFVDLKYWNYFSRFRLDISLGFSIGFSAAIRLICLICLIVYWCASLLVASLPFFRMHGIEHMYPSQFFGWYKLIIFPPRMCKLEGVRRVYSGLQHRMGLPFKAEFWNKFMAAFRRDYGGEGIHDPVYVHRLVCVLKALSSLVVGVLSFSPIIAICPPIYSWSEKYWSRPSGKNLIWSIVTFVLLFFSMFILVSLMLVTFFIYQRFVIFAISALIFHYYYMLNIMGVVAGCIGFIVKLHSNAVNGYISDRLLILEVVTKIHDEIVKDEDLETARKEWKELNAKAPTEKRLENGEKTKYVEAASGASSSEDRDEAENNAESGDDVAAQTKRIVVVPELLFWWAQMNFPCIPKRLYKILVRELRPVGNERAKVFLKVVLMAIFVNYVLRIMEVLGMGDDDEDSQLDVAKFVVTTIVVGIPSIVGSITPARVKEIQVLHKKGIIEEEVRRFLARHPQFYKYDQDPRQMELPAIAKEGDERLRSSEETPLAVEI